eukprot:gene18634-biopygen17425
MAAQSRPRRSLGHASVRERVQVFPGPGTGVHGLASALFGTHRRTHMAKPRFCYPDIETGESTVASIDENKTRRSAPRAPQRARVARHAKMSRHS